MPEAAAEVESGFLSDAQMRRLTDCARWKAQAAWLKEAGIVHRVVGTRVIVSWRYVHEWMDGRQAVSSSGLKVVAIK